jgi:hypothetical protein
MKLSEMEMHIYIRPAAILIFEWAYPIVYLHAMCTRRTLVLTECQTYPLFDVLRAQLAIQNKIIAMKLHTIVS